MRDRRVRFLVFAFSLSLAFPAGWCCAAPTFASEDSAAPIASCCQAARHADHSPATPSRPADHSHHCPCFDRVYTPPTANDSLHVHNFAMLDVSFAPVTLPIAVADWQPTPAEQIPVPHPPLFVLKNSWLF